LKIENTKGQLLRLTQNESNYQITGITGLNPPNAEINTIRNANKDGSTFSSSFLAERNIVLTVAFVGDVEKNRLKLYEFLSTGDKCKIYYSNNSRNVFCEGYVESNESDLFSNQQQAQISIICADPFLYALNQIYENISKTFDMFEFPFAIENEGTEISVFNENRRAEIVNAGEETGIEMKFFVKNDNITVINPIVYNAQTGEFIKLNTELSKGEEILINTSKGKKAIKKIINGIEHNIINTLESGSTWLSLKKGLNVFTYSADSNQKLLYVEFYYNVIYKGI
jgi:hypothetical protein